MLPGSELLQDFTLPWDGAGREALQGYAVDRAMISIFSIFRSKAGVKLTFYSDQILSTNAEG